MTNNERKMIRAEVQRLLDERAGLPWWAWIRRALLNYEMHTLLDSAL